MSISNRIQDELHALGITKRYHGYTQIICAIELALENENRLMDVTKQIYWVVADACACSRSCVERNIRTISHVAWKTNPARLKEIAGYPLTASPASSEFISIMVAHLQRIERAQPVSLS